MDDKYADLRAAAQSVIAEGGTAWFVADQILHEGVTGEFEPELPPIPVTDMTHIAACRPETILSILDDLDALRQQNVGFRDQHDRDSMTLRKYAQARDDARRERDRLHAAVRAMHKFLDRNYRIVGNCIELTCESHDQAWNFLHEARDIVRAALPALRAALRDIPAPRSKQAQRTREGRDAPGGPHD